MTGSGLAVRLSARHAAANWAAPALSSALGGVLAKLVKNSLLNRSGCEVQDPRKPEALGWQKPTVWAPISATVCSSVRPMRKNLARIRLGPNEPRLGAAPLATFTTPAAKPSVVASGSSASTAEPAVQPARSTRPERHATEGPSISLRASTADRVPTSAKEAPGEAACTLRSAATSGAMPALAGADELNGHCGPPTPVALV